MKFPCRFRHIERVGNQFIGFALVELSDKTPLPRAEDASPVRGMLMNADGRRVHYLDVAVISL
jgi:hypothetical protein